MATVSSSPNKLSLKREREAESPLPKPYPLPKHFASDVEAGIRAKDINILSKYLTSVASSMLCYKRYPSGSEYEHVASSIIQQYPWMESRVGTKTVNLTFSHSLTLFKLIIIMLQGTIVVTLQNRFKEFRREKKPKSVSKPAQKISKPAQKSPAKELMLRPEIPQGEDLASYLRFCSKITEEFKRRKPRPEVYESLVDLTYPHRRQEILDTGILVSDVLVKHPFLKVEDQVSMLRISQYIRYSAYSTVAERTRQGGS